MMSAQEGEVLEALAWLLRSLHERVAALEARQPTWASGYLAHADIAARLERLDRAAGAISARAAASPADPDELVRDPPGPAPNTPPMVQGGALRMAIANILETEPEATGPRVIEALRTSHAGKLPSPRTVRWHLQALRGNSGNGNGNAA